MRVREGTHANGRGAHMHGGCRARHIASAQPSALTGVAVVVLVADVHVAYGELQVADDSVDHRLEHAGVGAALGSRVLRGSIGTRARASHACCQPVRAPSLQPTPRWRCCQPARAPAPAAPPCPAALAPSLPPAAQRAASWRPEMQTPHPRLAGAGAECDGVGGGRYDTRVEGCASPRRAAG